MHMTSHYSKTLQPVLESHGREIVQNDIIADIDSDMYKISSQ